MLAIGGGGSLAIGQEFESLAGFQPLALAIAFEVHASCELLVTMDFGDGTKRRGFIDSALPGFVICAAAGHGIGGGGGELLGCRSLDGNKRKRRDENRWRRASSLGVGFS